MSTAAQTPDLELLDEVECDCGTTFAPRREGEVQCPACRELNGPAGGRGRKARTAAEKHSAAMDEKVRSIAEREGTVRPVVVRRGQPPAPTMEARVNTGCTDCGLPFQPGDGTRDGGKRHTPQGCQRARARVAAQEARERETREMLSSAPPPVPEPKPPKPKREARAKDAWQGETRTCAYSFCGREFTPRSANSAYCTPLCRERNQKGVELDEDGKPKARLRTCAREACGKEFMPTSPRQRYCTPDCRTLAQNAGDLVTKKERKSALKASRDEYIAVLLRKIEEPDCPEHVYDRVERILGVRAKKKE